MSLLTKLTAPELFAKKDNKKEQVAVEVAKEVTEEGNGTTSVAAEDDEFPHISKQQYNHLLATNEQFAREVAAIKLAQKAKQTDNENHHGNGAKRSRGSMNIAETKKAVFNVAFKKLPEADRASFLESCQKEAELLVERKRQRRKALLSTYSKLSPKHRVLVKQASGAFFAKVVERNSKQIKLLPVRTEELEDGAMLGVFDDDTEEYEEVVLPRQKALKMVVGTENLPVYWKED